MDVKLLRLLDNAIYNLYGAENDAALRTVFLNDLQSVVPYKVAIFDLETVYRGKKLYYDAITVNIPKTKMDEYYRDYVDKDYTSWLLNQPNLYNVYRDSDYISEAAKKDSVLYREWLQPMGLSYGCGMIIAYGKVVYGTVTLARGLDERDFSDKEMERLRILGRHLCRKFNLLCPNGVVFRKSEKEHEALRQAFDLTGRENEICNLIYNGRTPAAIADLLCISVSTVNRHIANIYSKLQINTRYELLEKMRQYFEGK